MARISEPSTTAIPSSGVRFRSVVGPLLLYHLLIVLGGSLMIVAILRGPSDLLVPGAAVLAAGLVAVVAVLAWAARLAARAAAMPATPVASATSAPWVCVRCGRSRLGHAGMCPVCGGWLTRSRSAPDEPDPPAV